MSHSELEVNEPVPYDLSTFELISILSKNSDRKTICVLGKLSHKSDTEQAIILLEKNAFDEKHLQENGGYFSAETLFKQGFVNDIYGNFLCFPNPDINSIKVTVICPATEKHIRKYTTQDVHIIEETAERYKSITLPHLLEEQFSLDWVQNILDHKKESDRIVFEDNNPETGFILLPDLKWDGKTIDTLYLVAICHRPNIKSLRDLTDEHLPLLRNIKVKGSAAITNKYNIERSQLRIYLHYQPSFYHLHVHFTYLKNAAPGISCEKSHLLDTVINNIELVSDYYKRVTLSFVVSQSDSLYKKYKKSEENSDEQCDGEYVEVKKRKLN